MSSRNGPSGRLPSTQPPKPPRCRVCRSTEITVRRLTRRSPGKTKSSRFHFCGRCGFVFNPRNRKSYEQDGTGFTAASKPAESRRAGDGVRGGREFFMLKTAIEILGRPDLDVLFHGSGLSLDHQLAHSLPEVATSHVTDLHNFQGSDNFIPLDSPRQFDVVICCEVVEHFVRPRRDFSTLFDFVKPDGLVVCSTSLNDGTPIEELDYPWSRGHVSFYSGASLLRIARQNKLHCDFRLPECALRDPGPRKRYVFFFRDAVIQGRIQETFARLPLALSERATNRRRAGAGADDPPSFRDLIDTARAWGKHSLQWRGTRLRRRFFSGG